MSPEINRTLLDNHTNEQLAKMKVSELEGIAERHVNNNVANRAMQVLKKKHDPTYHWCWDCDGLVTTKANCCLNANLNKDEDNKSC